MTSSQASPEFATAEQADALYTHVGALVKRSDATIASRTIDVPFQACPAAAETQFGKLKKELAGDYTDFFVAITNNALDEAVPVLISFNRNVYVARHYIQAHVGYQVYYGAPTAPYVGRSSNIRTYDVKQLSASPVAQMPRPIAESFNEVEEASYQEVAELVALIEHLRGL